MLAEPRAPGGGKTTLLNLIGCIDKPTQGTIFVGGQDVAALNDNAISDFRAQRVGFIFQNFSLIPVLSAPSDINGYSLFSQAPRPTPPPNSKSTHLRSAPPAPPS